MNAKLPNRQSIRKRGYDYTTSGHYFVTVNTHKGRALFGTVVNGRMVLSEAGRIAEEEWHKSAVIRKGIELDAFVVMPNHVHGVVKLKGFDASNPYMPSRSALSQRPQYGKPIAGALGTFVAAYKAAVSRAIGRRGLIPQGLMHQTRTAGASAIWHRNYWDVIVQDEQALANIRNYIRFNPQNYEAVMNIGEPSMVGNAELLKLPKVGFLASRGSGTGAQLGTPSQLPMKAGEAIISGFLSPMERAVFKAGLEHQRPLIWVMPFGVDLTRQAPATRRAIDDGRLLIVSPFVDTIDAPSVRRAAWCNHYALAHCNRLVIGHLNPAGMLSCILSEADPELQILYL